MDILITGASRGLGLEMAAEAAGRGYRVWAGTRQAPAAGSGLAELSSRHPGQVVPVLLDVADEQSVLRTFRDISERTEGLDIIVNNAAILEGRGQSIEELDLGQVERSFRTNLYGPLLVMKHGTALLRRKRGGAVINISSEAGSMAGAYGGDYSYALSKAALNMFTAQLRNLLERDGLLVLAVHPGWIRTDMGGGQAPGDAAESAKGILDLAERKRVPEAGAWFVDHSGKPMPL